MNGDRDAALAQRQQELIVRSAELRVALAYDARPLEAPLALADRVRRLAGAARDWAAANPLVVVAALATAAVLRPRRAWLWARRGWRVWRLVRLAKAMAASATAR